MIIALIVLILLVVIWAIATCGANDEDIILIETLEEENRKLKEELTILRSYISFNHLECDVMAYYGRSDENRGKSE